MSETEVCTKRVGSGWHRTACGRPVKGDGLCGLHLGAKKRVEANDEKRRVVSAQREAFNNVQLAWKRTFAEKHGIDLRAIHNSDWRAERFSITREDLEKLASSGRQDDTV